MRKPLVALGMIPGIALSLFAAPQAKPQPQPTWLVQRYCDTSFFRPYSPNGVPATNVICGARLWQDFNRVVIDARTTRRGAAFVAHAVFTAPRDGRYAFKLSPGEDNRAAARLCVGGFFADEQKDGVVELKAGPVALAVLVREKAAKDLKPKAKYHCASFDLLVKAPGEAAFAPAAVSYPKDVSVMARGYNRFDHEFTADEAIKRYYCYRTFAIDVAEDGWYEFGIREERPSYNIRVCLDDLQVIAHQTPAVSFDDEHFGEPAYDGDRHSLHLDFIPRMTRVRKLAKGRHLLDVYVYPGPWFPEPGSTEEMMRRGLLRVGYTRLKGLNPRGETGFWFDGRDDLVYETGETLRLSAGSACPQPREHVFEVREVGNERGGEGEGEKWKKPVHVQRLAVDSTIRAFTYPCAREGAFEYRVKDAEGRVVDGPWAFVVADPTPRPRARQDGTKAIPVAEEVVDAVVCTEGAGGAHQFREGGGASAVVTNAVGVVYRETGPGGCRNKRVERIGKPGSKDRKDNNYRLATEEEKKRSWYPVFAQLDWFAYTLKVRHPGRAHIVRCTVPNDRNRLVTCAAFDRKTGASNAWNLHAGCGPANAPTSYLSFFVWPNADAIDVMIPNTTGNQGGRLDRRGAVVKIELLECPDGHIPELPEAAGGWTEARGLGWLGEQGNIYVHERTMPPLWPDDAEWIRSEMSLEAYHSWLDLLISWDRFGELSAYRGDSLCAGPVFAYGMQVYQGPVSRICRPGRDVHCCGSHNEYVNLFDRDQFKLLLMKASRHNVRYVADFMIYIPEDEGAFWATAAGMPAETNSIFLSADASGRPKRCATSALINNPAHPVYRKTVVRFCEELARRYGKYPAFAGIRSRYWHSCAPGFEPWWFSRDLGFDDWTVALFAKEKGLDLRPVGTNEAAFVARRTDITNRFGKAWADWRTEKVLTLREEMLAAMRKYAPQANLFVTTEKWWLPEAGLDPAAFKGRRDLGYLPEQTWSGIGVPGETLEIGLLDGKTFDAFDVRPPEFRHIDHGTNEFSCGAYPFGLHCNSGYQSHPYQLQAPARALANNALKMLYAGGEWCLPPADEGLRAFVQTYRAIPDLDYVRFAAAHGSDTNAPYAAYTAQTEDGLVAWFVNATDGVLDFTAEFASRSFTLTDLTTGERSLFAKKLAFRLEPFMPKAVRLSGENALVALDVCAVGAGRERVIAAYRHLETFAPQAEKAGMREWAALFAPVAAAAKAEDWLRVDLLRRALFERERQYFLCFGWPVDEVCCTEPTFDSVWARSKRADCLSADREAGTFERLSRYDASLRREAPHCPAYVTADGKSVEMHFGGAWGGWRRLYVTALFGGGYGPLEVYVENKRVWTFPASPAAEARWETRLVPVPIASPANHYHVRFVGRGGKGAAVLGVREQEGPTHAVTRFRTAEGKVFDIGTNRTFRVSEAGTGRLTYWVTNTNRAHYATTFVVGAHACELTSGKRTLVKKSARPVKGRTYACADFPTGATTRFDLDLDRTQGDVEVGVYLYDSIGLEPGVEGPDKKR